jgi:hypothetical protein
LARTVTLPGVRLAATMLIGLCALALGGCGNTLQDQAIPHNILESLIESPFPVYWLGGSFQGLAVREATHDPGDAFNVQYGDCLSGGEGECVPPLRVITSPDNSFLPGGSTITHPLTIRGVRAQLANGGRAIVIATGNVVLDIYAHTPQLALAAAQATVPINVAGAPEGPLPARLANSGFGEAPLSFQRPAPPRPLR